MPFCPICRTEYVEGRVQCADCGVPLVPQLPPEEPSPVQPEEAESLVELTRTADYAEAHLIRGILQTNGVPCVLFDEVSASYSLWPVNALMPVRLMVPASKLGDARRLLREVEREVPAEVMEPGPQPDMTCPRCGEPARDIDHYCRHCGFQLREDDQ